MKEKLSQRGKNLPSGFYRIEVLIIGGYYLLYKKRP
jgi:hypothetical protein